MPTSTRITILNTNDSLKWNFSIFPMIKKPCKCENPAFHVYKHIDSYTGVKTGGGWMFDLCAYNLKITINSLNMLCS